MRLKISKLYILLFILCICTPSIVANPWNIDTHQLTAYSAMNMNVYSNSRVTSIQSMSNGFRVNGYMFEAWKPFHKPQAQWREIVLINAKDISTSKAYRKQVKSVYNQFLNNNRTATNNFQNDMSYANYTVEVNLDNMNAYETNQEGYKVTSGDYYIYMRISNGKESYLFPLIDRTLSDGSTMEINGTLPAGFSIKDQETRTLVYTVQ